VLPDLGDITNFSSEEVDFSMLRFAVAAAVLDAIGSQSYKQAEIAELLSLLGFVELPSVLVLLLTDYFRI
jgi:hypothetical protein